jgi:hypothetical protein
MENFLHINPTGLFLTTDLVFDGIKKIKDLLCINPRINCVFIDVAHSNLSIPNSLTIYLLLLVHYGAKQIILFGFDGFGNPKAFLNSKQSEIVENLKDADNYSQKSSLESYYCPELVERDRRIGFGNPTTSALFSDSPAFNDQFLDIYENYCKDYEIKPIKIWNCNLNSMFTLFEKIDYNKARTLCRI